MPIIDNRTKKSSNNTKKSKILSPDEIESAWANYSPPGEANWNNYDSLYQAHKCKLDSTSKSESSDSK